MMMMMIQKGGDAESFSEELQRPILPHQSKERNLGNDVSDSRGARSKVRYDEPPDSL